MSRMPLELPAALRKCSYSCGSKGLMETEAQTVSLYTTDARDHGGLKEHSVFFVYNAATWSANAADVHARANAFDQFLFINVVRVFDFLLKKCDILVNANEETPTEFKGCCQQHGSRWMGLF